MNKKEAWDLIKAWFILSLAFAIVFNSGKLLDYSIIFTFIVSAITVGLGFILHELGHRTLARRYGATAEFMASNTMLGLALVMSFFGFIFAAPGAVVIRGYLTKRKYGYISAAGPLTNIILGTAFLATAMFVPMQMVMTVCIVGMKINFWLALFNMLPFPMFDGMKVLRWNKIVYAAMLLVSVVAVFGSEYLLMA
jgi:Zn-dependent protease